MCAIAGYVGDVSKEKILAMLEATAHRGPDDQGIFIKDRVGLGHNRLAIIDLSSAGCQPMFDNEKNICIVFNGEIYNYQELRKELADDYPFRTKTDTEVILYAYKKWGYSALQRLNGMFAFVIYDFKRDLLFGARDRIGEKPLKYYLEGKTFAFASEVKGLLPVLDHKPEIDYEAINDYLTLQYVPAPKTGFKNVYKLPPGHYFIFKNGKLKIYKYWNLDFSKKLDISEDEWIEILEEKINSVVKMRMVSDVPLGAFLSGGVDSSAVVAFMAKNSNRPIKTFNIGFSDSEYDETDYAKEVSRIYRTDHTSIKVNSKMFKEIFTNMANYYDEPFADNSLIPSIVLSKLARKNMKVALSGDGGDENFAGYERYNIVELDKYFGEIPNGVVTAIKPLANLFYELFPSTFSLRAKTYWDVFKKPFYSRYLYYRCFFDNFEKNNIYSKDFKKAILGKDTFSIYKTIFSSKLDNLDNALKLDISSYLPEDLLFKMDIASMNYGLEVRAPLLDYKLMELSASIPSKYKIKFFNKKYLFKKMLLDKKLLPAGIVNRPKRGFNPPFKKWLKSDLRDYVFSELNSTKFRREEIFDDKKLDCYIKRYFHTKVDYSNNIFALLALASWINKYF